MSNYNKTNNSRTELWEVECMEKRSSLAIVSVQLQIIFTFETPGCRCNVPLFWGGPPFWRGCCQLMDMQSSMCGVCEREVEPWLDDLWPFLNQSHTNLFIVILMKNISTGRSLSYYFDLWTAISIDRRFRLQLWLCSAVQCSAFYVNVARGKY